VSSVAYVKVAAEMEKLEESTVAYYDNLTSAEKEEQSYWGHVGATSLLLARTSRR
jgi:hypothetical protein